MMQNGRKENKTGKVSGFRAPPITIRVIQMMYAGHGVGLGSGARTGRNKKRTKADTSSREIYNSGAAEVFNGP